MASPASSASIDTQRWVVFYPAYIDKNKSIQKGRRIPMKYAVENPTITEIHTILNASGMKSVPEPNKMYPRDGDREPEKMGRVRVQLKDEAGKIINPKFTSRLDVYREVAKSIPQLVTRQPGYVPPNAQSSAGGKKNKKKR